MAKCGRDHCDGHWLNYAQELDIGSKVVQMVPRPTGLSLEDVLTPAEGNRLADAVRPCEACAPTHTPPDVRRSRADEKSRARREARENPTLDADDDRSQPWWGAK